MRAYFLMCLGLPALSHSRNNQSSTCAMDCPRSSAATFKASFSSEVSRTSSRPSLAINERSPRYVVIEESSYGFRANGHAPDLFRFRDERGDHVLPRVRIEFPLCGNRVGISTGYEAKYLFEFGRFRQFLSHFDIDRYRSCALAPHPFGFVLHLLRAVKVARQPQGERSFWESASDNGYLFHADIVRDCTYNCKLKLAKSKYFGLFRGGVR